MKSEKVVKDTYSAAEIETKILLKYQEEDEKILPNKNDRHIISLIVRT